MTLQLSPTGVSCPVCEKDCSEPPLYRYTSSQAANYFCSRTRDEDRNQRLANCIQKLWPQGECAILRCKHCGFSFGYPFVGGDEEFYSIIHEQRGYPTWKSEYDMAIRHALEVMHGGKVLDIGAGKGFFLLRLNSKWERYAVEGSELTRRELESSGIRVFRDLSAAVEVHAATFQVVTLFQVLEHISEFRVMLEQCRKLLAIGGRLVVTVPDGDAMILQECLTGCPDMPPNHIGKWTPASLSHAFTEAGFEPQQAIFEPASWKNLKGAMYLRVLADAASTGSLTSQVYRIKSKPIRSLVLACLGIPALVRMLPHIQQLKQPGAFGMIGIAR